jgi:hypothetical protein
MSQLLESIISREASGELGQASSFLPVFKEWATLQTDNCKFTTVTRQEFIDQHQSQSIKQEGSQLIVTLPEDLKFWELAEFTTQLKLNTGQQEGQHMNVPESERLSSAQVLELAGVYLAQHAADLDSGQELCWETALTLYQHGQLFQSKEFLGSEQLRSVSDTPLSDEQVEKVERWILGDQVYSTVEQRISSLATKLNISPEEIRRTYRRRLLGMFFSSGELYNEARQLKQPFGTKQSNQRPAEVFSRFQRSLIQAEQQSRISSFGEALQSSFEVGTTQLLESLNVPQTTESLKDTFQLSEKKARLQELRDQLSADQVSSAEVAQLELEYAKGIQNLIREHYVYSPNSTSAQEIIDTATCSCVGRHYILGTFFRELGIPYAVNSARDHSTLTAELSDGSHYLFDIKTAVNTVIHLEKAGIKADLIKQISQVIHDQSIDGILPLTTSNEKLAFGGYTNIHISNANNGHFIQVLDTLAVRLGKQGNSSGTAAVRQIIIQNAPHFNQKG